MSRVRDIANILSGGSSAIATDAEITSAVSNQFVAGKNKIINGDFGIWQRGTSFTLSTGAVTFTADRFFMVMPGGTVVTRQTFIPGESPVAGYEGKHYIRTVINTNAQNYESGFRIEDVRTLAGQTATLSFWARSTVGAAALSYAIFQNFGTGGSPSSMVQASEITGSGPYTPTSQWQRYSYTFSIPSISGKTIGTNDNSYLLVRPFQFATTATNTSVDLWGVQLEAGSTATNFQTATGTIQGELAACQRYYSTSIPTGFTITDFSGMNQGSSSAVAWCSVGSTNDAFTNIQYPVPMRSAPTFNIYSAGNRTSGSMRDNVTGSDITVSNYSIQAGNNKGFNYMSGMSATAGRPYGFQWTASAEL
jgi:hypothetical protein